MNTNSKYFMFRIHLSSQVHRLAEFLIKKNEKMTAVRRTRRHHNQKLIIKLINKLCKSKRRAVRRTRRHHNLEGKQKNIIDVWIGKTEHFNQSSFRRCAMSVIYCEAQEKKLAKQMPPRWYLTVVDTRFYYQLVRATKFHLSGSYLSPCTLTIISGFPKFGVPEIRVHTVYML